MIDDQREIRRKLRVLEHAESSVAISGNQVQPVDEER